MGQILSLRNKEIIKVRKLQIFLLKVLNYLKVLTVSKFNSGAIDEFLVIFLVAAKARVFHISKTLLS